MQKNLLLIFTLALITSCTQTKDVAYLQKNDATQTTYWQQHIAYTMAIDVDAKINTKEHKKQFIQIIHQMN
jgi:hypothetical protein